MKSLRIEDEEVVTKATKGLKSCRVAGSLADTDEIPDLKTKVGNYYNSEVVTNSKLMINRKTLP